MTRRVRAPSPEPDSTDMADDNAPYEEEPDADFDNLAAKKAVVPHKQQQQKQVGRPAPAGGDLVDSFGRMAISATWSRQPTASASDYCHPIFQRSDHNFRQWIRGRGEAKAALPRRPSLPQMSPALPGRYGNDAPLVDLHIHIDHNNIGSLAVGTEERKSRKK